MMRMLALLALVALSPVMLGIAAAVLLSSGTPVLYSEWRLGRQGRPFRILKFRTLRPAPAVEQSVAPVGDARVTPLGRILRRSHLDELPQLLNIVRGEMTFVGPRPAVAKLWSEVPVELRQRALAFRPGLTSPASLRYLCEDHVLADVPDPETTYRLRIFPAKMAEDAAYFETRTAWSDLATLLRTPLAVLRHSNDRSCRHRIARLLRDADTRQRTETRSPERTPPRPGLEESRQ